MLHFRYLLFKADTGLQFKLFGVKCILNYFDMGRFSFLDTS